MAKRRGAGDAAVMARPNMDLEAALSVRRRRMIGKHAFLIPYGVSSNERLTDSPAWVLQARVSQRDLMMVDGDDVVGGEESNKKKGALSQYYNIAVETHLPPTCEPCKDTGDDDER